MLISHYNNYCFLPYPYERFGFLYGMCIETGMRLLFNPRVELLITLKEKGLNVTAKVSWILMIDSINDTMGVEVLNPPKEYLEFIDRLRPVCKS